MIITAANGTVRLRETIPAPSVGKVLSVRCTPTSGQPYTVRGFRDIEAPAEIIVVDHEAPLGQSLVYQVIVAGVVLSSATITVTSALPLLTHPVYGRSVPVTIQSWPERTHAQAGQVLPIADAKFPFIIDGMELAATSTLTTIAAAAAHDDLEALLAGQSMLRVRPTCSHIPADWVSVRGRRTRRFSLRADSAHVDALELQHVAMPDPDTAAVGNTLGDLHAAYPVKLGDINAAFPGTLGDIAFADLTL